MDEFLAGMICGSVIVSVVLVSVYSSPAQIKQIKQIEQKMQKEAIQIEQNMQKQAISHGAAHYEVDTNGVVSFKWNK
jgi:outer membrane murein-binding lipoprotein Lpp